MRSSDKSLLSSIVAVALASLVGLILYVLTSVAAFVVAMAMDAMEVAMLC